MEGIVRTAFKKLLEGRESSHCLGASIGSREIDSSEVGSQAHNHIRDDEVNLSEGTASSRAHLGDDLRDKADGKLDLELGGEGTVLTRN